VSELKDHRFSEYYLYFTNTISTYFIEKVAEVDEQDIVKQIQEIFMDFCCI
jgi:vacuolar protein sorting-associated protein 45